MPTYEYLCPACKHRFEKFQSIKDQPLGTCPVCGGSVERMIGSGAGFIFKGSGFYATDHRSKNYQERAKAETNNVSSAPASTPATKPEPKKE